MYTYVGALLLINSLIKLCLLLFNYLYLFVYIFFTFKDYFNFICPVKETFDKNQLSLNLSNYLNIKES